MAHDTRITGVPTGLAFAVLSATSFALSGPLARGLMDLGWTAGSATLARVAIAAVVLAIPGGMAMRGRWEVLRTAWLTIMFYGLFAVAGTQFFYFLAIGYLDVSIALLIEYTAPVFVVAWMWLRHGHRPGALTYVGGAVAIVGLVFLLDVVGGGGGADPIGVMFALAATSGAVVYFILSGKLDTGLPAVSLASGGLLVATAILGLVLALGIIPSGFATGTVQLIPLAMPWWLAVLLLGLVAAALAYVTGIAAVRRLGARLASFVALSEVVAAATFAWILLGQELGPVQLTGAALVLGGVVLVKLGEPRDEAAVDVEELLAADDVPSDHQPSSLERPPLGP